MRGFGTTPGMLNLVSYQGDTFKLGIELSDDDTPVNLTGMEVEFSIAVVRGGRPAFQYTTADGMVSIPDPVNGEIEILIPERETKKWHDIRYTYEVTVRDGVGYAETFLTGTLAVMREAVR